MFKRKYSISIIDDNWNKLVDTVNLKYIPRRDELVYIESAKKYFKVLNVIHYLTKNQGIFLVVKPVEQELLPQS